ncbi:MAG: CHASE2 domain-containing protein, partial [Rivularia sp. ALOHA_DT_140]|nr:CHASE2 domain-containing protein [Rivularia sp. ALOHA_DT_140]
AFLSSRSGGLSERDQTLAPQVLDRDRNNSIQDSTRVSWWRTIVVTSLGVTVLVLGTRELGWLQRWELRAYDQMILLRPPEEPDKRIVLVTVDDRDLQKYKNPLSDEIINQLLKKIQSYQPRIIGLNIKRPQQTNLAEGINKKNIIVSCAFKTEYKPEIPPPPKFALQNTGFTDLIPDVDIDGVLRRALVLAYPEENSSCDADGYSFAITLAMNYLRLDVNPTKNEGFYIGKVRFPALTNNSASYINLDYKGWQIIINYRNPRNFADTVSLTDVLTDKVKPSLFKNRLVIIGTNLRGEMLYPTPYSTSRQQESKISGVFIHAQTTSQLISAVLNSRPSIWYFPEWLEAIWTFFWSLIGGFLAWKVRRPVFLLIVSAVAVSGLVGICYLLIIQAGWIPVVPPGLALVFAAIGVLGYASYQNELQTKVILVEVEKQKEAIEQLNTILNETSGIQDAPRIQPIAPAATISSSTSGLLSNRYKVTIILAQGGFGCTYLAKDTQRPGLPTCVVKQLMPARTDTRFLQVARRLFNSEAEILELLGQHHQIPELYAVFEENKEFYLVQQFIPGHPLTDELPPLKDIKTESEVISMRKELL